MLVVWASVGFAQEVTLDFTNAIDDWGISATATAKATKFTNGVHIQLRQVKVLNNKEKVFY